MTHAQISAGADNSRSRFAFLFHASTLATFFAASAVPTPLYRLYQAEWSLSTLSVTLVFAVYAFSLLAALLSFGSISDHIGRRKAIAASLVVQFAALMLFATANGFASLVAARLVQGVATGAAMSALGAALVDLDVKRGSVAASLSPLFGMAAGALGSSALVQFGPAPLHLVYAVFGVAVVLQLVAIARVPETAVLRPGGLKALMPSVSVPPAARRAMAIVTPLNIAGWTLGGFYLSLMPSLVARSTGISAPLLGGGVVAALMLSGGITIAFLRGRDAEQLSLGASVGLIAGIAVLTIGVHSGSVPVLLAGTLIVGTGFGTGFLGSIGTLVPLAAPQERASLLSAFYVESYLAMSIPAIAAGFAAGAFGLKPTTDICAAIVVILAAGGILARLAIGVAPRTTCKEGAGA